MWLLELLSIPDSSAIVFIFFGVVGAAVSTKWQVETDITPLLHYLTEKALQAQKRIVWSLKEMENSALTTKKGL